MRRDMRDPGTWLRRLLRRAPRGGVVALHRAAGFGGRRGAAGRFGLPLVELETRLRVFELFRWGEAAAGLAPADSSPLEAGVRGALRLDAWQALWVLEGLAFARGVAAARPGRGPGDGIPTRWWIPLHTGTGCALADEALGPMRKARGESELARRVAALVERCGALSAPGYALATFEPFGFMTAMLEPGLARRVAGHLAALDPELWSAFWHGVGRGSYFAAWGSAGRSLVEAWRAAPGRSEALEVLSGATWALTLVHLGRPGIVAAGIAEAGRRLSPEGRLAMSDGVASAVLVWHHGHGFDPLLAGLLDQGAEAPTLWEEIAVEPCRRVLDRAEPPGCGRPGELFRYHPPDQA